MFGKIKIDKSNIKIDSVSETIKLFASYKKAMIFSYILFNSTVLRVYLTY